MVVKVLNTLGEEVSSLKLKDAVFNAEYNEGLIHQVVVATLANKRQGNKSTLTRSEVRGHAKKPWKQKHTGRARHGSTKGPQWRGGGVVFAPKPRDFSKKVNKEMKRAAFISAISTKLKNNEVMFIDKLELANPKTKEFAKILENLKLNKSVIFVDRAKNDLILRASNNIEHVTITTADLLGVYEVIRNTKVVLTTDAAKYLEEAYA